MLLPVLVDGGRVLGDLLGVPDAAHRGADARVAEHRQQRAGMARPEALTAEPIRGENLGRTHCDEAT